MNTSVVVSTIGGPWALANLESLGSWNEVLVVIDMTGRAESTLEATAPLVEFEEQVRALGATPIRYETEPSKWAVMNGCFNVGARAARNDWVLFTHDDVTWEPYNYAAYVDRAATWLDSQQCRVADRQVVGIILPIWEVQHNVLVPNFPPTPNPLLTQCVGPVGQVLRRDRLAEMGFFDEAFGVWYDGQLAQEAQLRKWWFLHLPTPAAKHQSNSTYRINDWANGWKQNPKWGEFDKNFRRMYGVPHVRSLGDQPDLLDVTF